MNDNQDNARVVKWAELAKCASWAFSWWADWDLEAKWAEQSWVVLEDHGLTSYTRGAERCKVLIRFMALAEIFNDFLFAAWKLDNTTQFTDIAYALDIDRRSIIDFAKTNLSWFEKETLLNLLTPEEVPFDYILADLCDEARPEIFEALERGYGDSYLLLLSLWRCHPTYFNDSEEQILSDVDLLGSDGLYWLTFERNSLRWDREHFQ